MRGDLILDRYQLFSDVFLSSLNEELPELLISGYQLRENIFDTLGWQSRNLVFLHPGVSGLSGCVASRINTEVDAHVLDCRPLHLLVSGTTH